MILQTAGGVISPSGRIEVISMGMKTEYGVVTTVEEILDYIGDSKEVAFDYETAPNDEYRDEDKATLNPAKSHIVTMSIRVKEGTGIMMPVAHKIGKNIDHEAFVIFLQAFLMRPSWINVCCRTVYSRRLGGLV